MARELAGMKIRARREALGMKQGELARRAGVSAPYLNLIEGNRRPVSEALLARIAAGLGVETGDIDGFAERRLVQSLDELAADPRFAPETGEPLDAEKLVGLNPQWSAMIFRLRQAYEDQRQSVMALADRLNHDPFLGENVHQILTSAASLRSAAEILARGDLSTEERQRFGTIVRMDGDRLTDRANALLGFFDSRETRIRSATLSEHVDAFILAHNYHFPMLETLAEKHLGSPGGRNLQSTMRESDQPPIATLPESGRFAHARDIARNIGAEAVTGIVNDHPTLPTDEARRVAQDALYSYLAGALLMPYGTFLETARRVRYDLDALCQHFAATYEQVAHRLATLRRPGNEGVSFAFMRSDVSGHVTKRLPLPNLPLPRFSTACPKWVIYEAFQAPGVVVRQLGELPTGERFFFFARAIDKLPPSVGQPRRLMAVMLACPADQAGNLAYGDGLNFRHAAVPVGIVCRLCPRRECGYRQEEMIVRGPATPDQGRMANSGHSG